MSQYLKKHSTANPQGTHSCLHQAQARGFLSEETGPAHWDHIYQHRPCTLRPHYAPTGLRQM